MKRLLDYDPISGVSCYYEHTADNVVLTHEQDVRLIQSILDQNKRDANNESKTKKGIKEDWWKYASIPAIVEIEWLQKYGVNLNDPAHKSKIFKLLNHPDYRYLKTTTKVHHVSAD